MIKLLKRYKVVGLLIVLCFLSAFISLCNGLLSIMQINDLVKEQNEYNYAYEVQVDIELAKEVTPETLLKLVDGVDDCNVYLEGMTVYFNEIEGLFMPSILISQNETLSLPTKSNITNLPENNVIASTNIVSDLKTLNVHDTTFYIYDTIDSEKFPFIGSSFVMNFNDYYKVFPDGLSGNKEFSLTLSSNKNDVYNSYNIIEQNLNSYVPNSIINYYVMDNSENLLNNVSSLQSLMPMALFIFALINTIIIAYYWVIVRRREIAIRKSYGASNFSITCLLAKDLFKLISLSAITAIIVQLFIWLMQGNSIVSIQNIIYIMISILLSISVAVLIAMVIPVRIILKIQPSEGVKL